MSYCSSCGQAITESAKFCASCGTIVAGQSPLATAQTGSLPAKVVIVEPKRGGMLALKGFLLSLGLGVIGGLTLSPGLSNSTEKQMWNGVAFVVGAAYIALSLCRWKQQRDVVRGEALAWIVAVVLGISSIGGLIGAGGSSGSTAPPGNSSLGAGATGAVQIDLPRKDVLMQQVKLNFDWEKSGFGNVMMADFTIHNPTQFRFKDFEITCTHYAPSGTRIDSNTRTIMKWLNPIRVSISRK